MLDSTKGFSSYTSFKYVRKFKFCVNALVKRYQLNVTGWDSINKSAGSTVLWGAFASPINAIRLRK